MYEVINSENQAFFVMNGEKLIATLHADQFESPAHAEIMANYIANHEKVMDVLAKASGQLEVAQNELLIDTVSEKIKKLASKIIKTKN